MAAAEELHVTPTAISHQIKALEDYLGKPLFRRRPRPMTLTEAGERLYPVLRDGFGQFAAALDEIHDPATIQRLKITTTTAFASRWLVPRLESFRAEAEHIDLEVHASEMPVDLHAGEADIAIRYGATPGGDLRWHELFRDRYVPVCHQALVADAELPLRPSELAARPLIHFEWKRPTRLTPTWERWFGESPAADSGDGLHKPLGRKLAFSEESHAIEAALAGQGIALLSDVLVAGELKSGTLVQVHPFALEGFTFHAVHLPHSAKADVIDDFIEWAKGQHGAARDTATRSI
ncbi:LysR substrate-binding domain-containing protein [Spiribacter halobius]|uniref:LysR substrate-binding domain-containing protein n=1 Tax=Sediminicurvatus halobius TaxID=2182432 RepID=UPI001E4985CB